MANKKYNIWFALLYEVLWDLSNHFKGLKRNKIILMILKYCKHDWINWRVESAIKDVDQQAEKIVKEWEKLDPPKYTITEHPPDGSRAQQLLGGAIEINGNFRRD